MERSIGDITQNARGMEKTLARPIVCSGVGIHTGTPVKMTLQPAPARHGIVFVRTDLGKRITKGITKGISKGVTKETSCAATWDNVIDTSMCTVIGNGDGMTVSTIEHLMAALRGCGIDNAVVKLDGPEVPIMDGSSAPFVAAIRRVGVILQNARRRYTIVLKTVEVRQGTAYARLRPVLPIGLPTAERPFYRMTFDAHGRLATQAHTFVYYPIRDNFVDCLANARTFGFFEDAERLWAMGLAKGASPANTIVIEKDGGIMNPEGLRYEDEFVRHKVLDAVGDLALAHGHIDGSYEGYNAGHKLNNLLLRALYADESAWRSSNEYDRKHQLSAAC